MLRLQPCLARWMGWIFIVMTEELEQFIEDNTCSVNGTEIFSVRGDGVGELRNLIAKATKVELCQCSTEYNTGWTVVRCCNRCGKPLEKFWTL